MVGPLDSQIVINQSAATEKVQEVQQRHPDLQQRHFALKLEQEQEKMKRDVRETEKPDQAVIRNREKKEEKSKRRQKSERGRMKMGETSLSEEEDEETGGRVDVFV